MSSQPEPTGADDVLADRVRSTLGPLEKRLDLPHVHVTVEKRVVLRHGDVGTEQDAAALEEATADVAGVEGVRSYLHVGLGPGDTRPSQGRRRPAPSPAMERLLAAARHAGELDDERARAAVRGVLATLAERLPKKERHHLLSHLPADVRAVAQPPRRRGSEEGRVATAAEFVATMATLARLDSGEDEYIAESVLGALRLLVAEEAADVAAALPPDLQRYWDDALPH